ncbi:hypothetical protein GDO86_016657, partial [Hymenochirus boettgeri]
GAADRPVVFFSPNWTPIFTGESINLTCNVDPPVQWNLLYTWYRDGNWIRGDQRSLVIRYALVVDSGNYQCQAGGSERSDPVRLDVTGIDMILQAPLFVHEGDFLSLRCHSRYSNRDPGIRFYKDDELIQSPVNGSVVNIGRVNVTASGTYTCERNNSNSITLKPKVNITVTELFSRPQIKLNPSPVVQGENMTVTCDTKPSPRGASTELQFGFYRNGINVQGFYSSNQYRVPSAQLEDSGNYTCEVQTVTGSVRKRSNIEHIQIQKLFTVPQINVSPDPVILEDHMTITCDIKPSPRGATTELQIAFYRNGTNVQGFNSSNQYRVPSAQLEDSGNYTCMVQTSHGTVRKRSNILQIQIKGEFE